MLFFVYNILLCLAYPFAALYMLWRHFRQGKSAAAWWGRVPQDVPNALKSTFPRFWIHAVSVGEVMAARIVARALKSTFPNCGIVISTTTDTGQNAAQQAREQGECDAIFYYPVDFAWTVNRVFKIVQPDAVLLMETELWPNFLHIANRRGIKIFQVNGRVSDNLLRQASRWKVIWRWMTGNLTMIFARSDFDLTRLQHLGIAPEKVLLTGDVKWESMEIADGIAMERQKIRRILRIDENALFWIGGSTHEGEDEILLQAHRQLLRRFPDLRLMIAPRHPERVESVMRKIKDAGFSAVRRSEIERTNPKDSPTIVLDTVGELAKFYAAADAAFVGGSLIKRGGHNVSEPILMGVPVLFGPYTYNFRDAVKLVQSVGVGQEITTQESLQKALEYWLDNEDARRHISTQVRLHLAKHRGAAQRVAENIAQIIAE